MLLKPTVKNRVPNIQITRSLNNGNTTLFDQTYSLKLELRQKFPSLNLKPPAPQKNFNSVST